MPREIQLSDAAVHALIGSICASNKAACDRLIAIAEQPLEERSGVSFQNVKQDIEMLASSLQVIADVNDGKVTVG